MRKPRAAIYIGDGSSRANPLTPEQFDAAVNNLAAEHVPVTTFGIGPRMDAQVLGALAVRTGGNAMHDSATVGADAIGASLADAVRGTVLWPKADAANFPPGVDVYPKPLPPLRSDRETVLVGTAKTLPKQIDIDCGAEKLSWNVPDFKSDPGNAYLVNLVDQAKVDGGKTLPLVDADSLTNAKKEIQAGGKGLNRLAEVALSAGQFDKAGQLADEALKRNPSDLRAKAVKDAVAKKAGGELKIPLSPGAGPAGPPPVPARPPVAGGEPGDLNMGDGGAPPPAGAAVEGVANQDRAFVEQLQKKVDIAINRARKEVDVNPEAATLIIQQQIDEVSAATEPSSEDKDRMLRRLEVEKKDIAQRKTVFELNRQRQNEDAASRREQEMENASLRQAQTKVQQLYDRMDYLMLEGRHSDAEKAASLANEISQRAPFPNNRPTEMVALNWPRFTGAFTDIMTVRTKSQRGFVDALFEVEKSHVPTPDEPPIVYPDSEWWKEMSKRRKEKYGSMDLKIPSPAEKAIEEALKATTPPIEFGETLLKDIIDYLKAATKPPIEIQLDAAGLKDANVEPDTLVSKNIRGVSLRSALKLLLDDLGLKYVIHNEVLLITSPAKAESDEFMTTKVYPVADLVLPIQNNMMSGFGGMGGGMMGGMGGMGGGMGGMGGGMGGGMMGGGMGGMGGGMGGMGGGMGGGMMGGMGGMGGGGMGGMGGGFFAVPPESVPTDAAAVNPNADAQSVAAATSAQPPTIAAIAPAHAALPPTNSASRSPAGLQQRFPTWSRSTWRLLLALM